MLVTSPPIGDRGYRLAPGPKATRETTWRLSREYSAHSYQKPQTSRHCVDHLGDAFNTPVNWSLDDRKYSSLGPDKNGLADHNSAYTKPRAKRKAFIDAEAAWLQYGNLLALPNRLVLALCDVGYLFRGRSFGKSATPCRRDAAGDHIVNMTDFPPSQRREPLLPRIATRGECVGHIKRKDFGPSPFFPLPRRAATALYRCLRPTGPATVVLDPFSGSGTTGIAALKLGCSYIGFEIDPEQVAASNQRLRDVRTPIYPFLGRTKLFPSPQNELGKSIVWI